MSFFHKTEPVFFLGCQRSGTTIGIKIFRESDLFDVKGEGSTIAMERYVRLRSPKIIRKIIRRSDARYLIFKPINDSHLADKILSEYRTSYIIWMYRNVFDVVNSAIKKWDDAQSQMISLISKSIRSHDSIDAALPDIIKKSPKAAIYAERLDDQLIKLLLDWTSKPISAETGAAIMWYLRNYFYFKLELDVNNRVLLVRYEDFVRFPVDQVSKICDFLGAPYSHSMSNYLNDSSIKKNDEPIIDIDVLLKCQNLDKKFKLKLGIDH